MSFQPDNVEASTYLQDANNRINEPIEREMKIAKLKMDRGEYLDAIKSLQRVKELDPDNAQAAQLNTQAIEALEKQAAAQTTEGHGGENAALKFGATSRRAGPFTAKDWCSILRAILRGAAGVWEQAVRVDDGNVLARSAYNRAQIEMHEKP